MCGAGGRLGSQFVRCRCRSRHRAPPRRCPPPAATPRRPRPGPGAGGLGAGGRPTSYRPSPSRPSPYPVAGAPWVFVPRPVPGSGTRASPRDRPVTADRSMHRTAVYRCSLTAFRPTAGHSAVIPVARRRGSINRTHSNIRHSTIIDTIQHKLKNPGSRAPRPTAANRDAAGGKLGNKMWYHSRRRLQTKTETARASHSSTAATKPREAPGSSKVVI